MSRTLFALPLFWILLNPSMAWAYTDPGTGALALQLVFGGIAGLAVVLKLFWAAIKRRVAGHVQRPRRTDAA